MLIIPCKLMWIDLNNLSQFTSTDPRIYGPDQEDATFYRKFGNCGIVWGLNSPTYSATLDTS